MGVAELGQGSKHSGALFGGRDGLEDIGERSGEGCCRLVAVGDDVMDGMAGPWMGECDGAHDAGCC
jgi:hypothetical protein